MRKVFYNTDGSVKNTLRAVYDNCSNDMHKYAITTKLLWLHFWDYKWSNLNSENNNFHNHDQINEESCTPII